MRFISACSALAIIVPLSLTAQSVPRPTTQADPPSFEFRGHVLGEPLTGVSDCGYSGPNECENFGQGINGAAVDIFYHAVEGGFEGLDLTFHSDMFSAIRDAFVAKYGPPDSTEDQPFETRSGAKATNRVLTWKFAQGTLTLSRFDISLVKGAATIATARYKTASEARRKHEAAQAAGKDM